MYTRIVSAFNTSNPASARSRMTVLYLLIIMRTNPAVSFETLPAILYTSLCRGRKRQTVVSTANRWRFAQFFSSVVVNAFMWDENCTIFCISPSPPSCHCLDPRPPPSLYMVIRPALAYSTDFGLGQICRGCGDCDGCEACP